MSDSPIELVREFYRVVGNPIRESPTADVPDGEVEGIIELLDEEVQELREALGDKDLAGIEEEVGDVLYVVYGIVLQFGIDLDRVLSETHAKNMSKPNADGTVVKSKHGKILRGDVYMERS